MQAAGDCCLPQHGKVKATIETQPLEAINDVFARLKRGDVQGRVVLADRVRQRRGGHERGGGGADGSGDRR